MGYLVRIGEDLGLVMSQGNLEWQLQSMSCSCIRVGELVLL